MGQNIWQWIVAHQLLLYIAFAILVEPMPHPDEKSSTFYIYFYSVIQLVSAKWTSTVSALKSQIPPPQIPPPTPTAPIPPTDPTKKPS